MKKQVKQLRVWHIENIPNEPTYHKVKSIKEAKKLIRALVEEDLKDKSVCSNAFGLEERESQGEWSEWYNDEGMDIMEVIDEEDEAE